MNQKKKKILNKDNNKTFDFFNAKTLKTNNNIDSIMLNDNKSVNRNTNLLTNNNTTALHLLASGPLFSNVNEHSTNNSISGISTQKMPPSFTTSLPEPAGVPLHSNPAHFAQLSQQIAALAAVSAMANGNNINNSLQPTQTTDYQAIIAAQAATAANASLPFSHYPPQAMRHPFMGSMYLEAAAAAGSQYHPYAIDVGRRKNATREVTQPLKAWLKEHAKNPYPSKPEKTVLAIITKMTMTQVSTWFANARRRLKKENKMTWSPRNSRNADDDDVDEDIDDRNAERPSSSISVFSDEPRKDVLENLSDNGQPSSKTDNNFLNSNNTNNLKNFNNPQKKIWSIADSVTNSNNLKSETKFVNLSSASDSGQINSVLNSALKTMGNPNMSENFIDYNSFVFNLITNSKLNNGNLSFDNINAPNFISTNTENLKNDEQQQTSGNTNGFHSSVFSTFPFPSNGINQLNQQTAIALLVAAQQQQLQQKISINQQTQPAFLALMLQQQQKQELNSKIFTKDLNYSADCDSKQEKLQNESNLSSLQSSQTPSPKQNLNCNSRSQSPEPLKKNQINAKILNDIKTSPSLSQKIVPTSKNLQ